MYISLRCIACKSIMRMDARETLKDMPTKALHLLFVCICSADLSFFLTYTRANTYIVQLLLAASTTFCPFFLFTFFPFSCRCVFRSIFSALYIYVYICVCRFDDVVYRDDDMTKREKEEREASSSNSNSSKENKKKE